jgi:cytochrome c oxidase assembly factor CtaG
MSAPSVLDLLGRWRLDPLLTLALLGGAAVYVSAAWNVTRAARRRGTGARGWPLARGAAFIAGLAAIAVALQSGLDRYDGELLSVHMAQHLVLMLLAPPLLLAGAPLTLALRSLPRGLRSQLAAALRSGAVRAVARPSVGIAAAALPLLLFHLTPLSGLALRVPLVHQSEHLLYLTGGLLFFSGLIAPGPATHRLGGLAAVLYVSVAMPLMSVVGVILLADPTLRLHAYLAPARRLGVSALADQRLAGLLMISADVLASGAVGLAIAWRAMLAEERRAVARETRASERPFALRGGHT